MEQSGAKLRHHPRRQYFIMARPVPIPDQRVTRLNVVLNWFDELKKRTAPKRAVNIETQPSKSMTPGRWRQVEDVYHAAPKRAPGARGAFLAGTCGPDVDLRDEVESLLADGPFAGGHHRTARLFPGSAGSRFGPNCMETSIGKGGMGGHGRRRISG